MSELPISQFSVRRYRSIQEARINKFNRITLFTSRNGGGKRTLLEAIYWYLANGSIMVAREILLEAGEITETKEEWWEKLFTEYFYRRILLEMDQQKIRIILKTDTVEISPDFCKQKLEYSVDYNDDTPPVKILFDYSGKLESEKPLIGPGYRCPVEFVNDYWSHLFTDSYCKKISEILRISDNREFIKNVIEGMTRMKVDSLYSTSNSLRSLKIRFLNHTEYHLYSLGSAVSQVIEYCFALLSARDGVLLIQGFGNNISVDNLRFVWEFLYQAAVHYNVQIIASTVNIECIREFTFLLKKYGVDKGHYFRMEGLDKKIIVEYEEDSLIEAIKHNLMVY